MFNIKYLSATQAKHGSFVYFRNDAPIGTCLAQYGEWAESELDIISKLITPSSNCIDIGSNIGTHTVWFSKACPNGIIYAIEPQFLTFQILTTNIVLNECFNVIPLNIGIYDRYDTMNLMVQDPTSQYVINYGMFNLEYLGNEQFSKERPEDCVFSHAKHKKINSIPTEVKPLDSIQFIVDSIDFIKMDCEGGEYRILKGGKNTISKYKPHMLIEYNADNPNDDSFATSDMLYDLLKEYGYNIYWQIYSRHNPNNYKKSHNIYSLPENHREMYECNIIAIHSDKDQGLFTDKVERGQYKRDRLKTYGQVV